jgi:hypothetical protein
MSARQEALAVSKQFVIPFLFLFHILKFFKPVAIDWFVAVKWRVCRFSTDEITTTILLILTDEFLVDFGSGLHWEEPIVLRL